MKQCASRLAAAMDWQPSELQETQLETYARWLADEAIPAGGLGPGEADRIWERHICDALSYAAVIPTSPKTVLDVGTGVGLPGIPLAIRWPAADITLLDRSGRRVDLCRRATRVLRLPNVAVIRGEPATADTTRFELVVVRAVFEPTVAIRELTGLTTERGSLVVGIHRGSDPPEMPAPRPGFDLDLRSIEVLDPPAWLLKMTRT